MKAKRPVAKAKADAKRPSPSKGKAGCPPAKPPAQKRIPAKSDEQPLPRLILDERLRRNWIRVRQAWGIDAIHFSAALSGLSDTDGLMLLSLVSLALYHDTSAAALSASPQLKGFLRSEDDRFCMIDAYENLSWRFRVKVPPPSFRALSAGLKARMGEKPDFLK